MSNNTKEKTNLKLNDLPFNISKNDVESFLSKYKEKINNISIEEIKTYKDTKKIAKVSFKDNKSADDCRINMNLRKINNSSIRIMWDDIDSQFQNNNKSNLYIKNIPKEKNAREIFEFFHKFGDIYSIKINEDEKGNNVGTGYITYYNQDCAKKAIDETNGNKIWDSKMELQYQNQFRNERNNLRNNYKNENFKININNIPDSFTNKDIEELCKEFGKIQSHNIFNGQNGKYGVVVFSTEQEAKNATEHLNNKEINGKKLVVKENKRKSNYIQNNNYNNYNNYYNQYQNYEEPYENANLYIKNIPFTIKEEDLNKIFEPFGTIKSIKIEKEIIEKKDNSETKKVTANKGFGYISFENVDSAKKALESLNNKYIPGFESWSRPLSIDFYIPKQKRQMMDNMPQVSINYYGIQTGINYPPYAQYPHPQMFRMPFPYQFNNNMWHQGNYKNIGYNGGYRQKYNKRGGYRGGYYKNNHQRKNNINSNNQNQNNINFIENNINQSQNNPEIHEEKKNFDYDAYNKLNNPEDKKDFIGSMIFNSIQENQYIVEKGIGDDTVAKITGMILEIPNEKEIIEILEKPSALNARILEALDLLNIKK